MMNFIENLERGYEIMSKAEDLFNCIRYTQSLTNEEVLELEKEIEDKT